MMKRKLEELNLLDDFLFNEMTEKEGVNEKFCRILLETILMRELGKVKIITQKKVQGRGTDKHGIVIDAYIEASEKNSETDENLLDAEIETEIFDMEPNKYEQGSIPQKGRYYHALIDTKLLKTGVNYENLKNVTIIMILPYDPFGKDLVMYTISNQCKEDPDIEYDDGVKTIYLYTKGTKGNASQKLRDMLRYIEESTLENAVNDELRSIHEMVTEIKQDEEVGISYMKKWEEERYIREEAIREGRAEGIARGRAETKVEDIGILIDSLRSFQVPEESILSELREKYNLTEEEADKYLKAAV